MEKFTSDEKTNVLDLHQIGGKIVAGQEHPALLEDDDDIIGELLKDCEDILDMELAAIVEPANSEHDLPEMNYGELSDQELLNSLHLKMHELKETSLRQQFFLNEILSFGPFES